MWQVLGASLEAHVAASNNSALAKDCRKEIKAANAALVRLTRKVVLSQKAPLQPNAYPVESSAEAADCSACCKHRPLQVE